MRKNFVKKLMIYKVIQMVLLIGIDLTFFFILLFNQELRISVFSDQALFCLCLLTWLLVLIGLVSLFVDFYQLRGFGEESHFLNQAAYLDSLTGIPNRYSCDLMFKMYASSENLENIGCVLLEISNLKDINESFGFETGDSTIQDFCLILDEIGDSYGFVGRNSGNEFICVIENCSSDKMNSFLSELNTRLNYYNALHDDTRIYLRSSYVLNSEAHTTRFNELLTLTYEKLHNE